jgi:hypothetical protein
MNDKEPWWMGGRMVVVVGRSSVSGWVIVWMMSWTVDDEWWESEEGWRVLGVGEWESGEGWKVLGVGGEKVKEDERSCG